MSRYDGEYFDHLVRLAMERGLDKKTARKLAVKYLDMTVAGKRPNGWARHGRPWIRG